MKQRTYKYQVIVKDCTRNFGLGVGVVGELDTVWDAKPGRPLSGPVFEASVILHEREVLDRFIEVKCVETTKKVDKRKRK